MLYASLYLWRTTRIVRTVVGSLAFVSHKRSSTFRTSLDELNRHCILLTFLYSYAYNLGYNLTTFLYIHIITDMQIKATDEILIVQCGTLYDSTSQLYGVHIGYRSHSTGSSDLIGDFIESCASPFGLKLICYCPTRRLGCISKSTLLAQRIHLQHYAIGSYRQVLSLGVPIVYELVYFLKTAYLLHTLRNFESPMSRSLQILIVSFSRKIVAQQIIQISVKASTGYKLGVLTLQCTARSIAGIGKQWFFGSLTLGIQLFKNLPWHEYFTTYLKLFWIARTLFQHKWYATNGLHISRNIITMNTITTRYATHEFTVNISKRY